MMRFTFATTPVLRYSSLRANQIKKVCFVSVRDIFNIIQNLHLLAISDNSDEAAADTYPAFCPAIYASGEPGVYRSELHD
jgi:hypothetical protein